MSQLDLKHEDVPKSSSTLAGNTIQDIGGDFEDAGDVKSKDFDARKSKRRSRSNVPGAADSEGPESPNPARSISRPGYSRGASEATRLGSTDELDTVSRHRRPGRKTDRSASGMLATQSSMVDGPKLDAVPIVEIKEPTVMFTPDGAERPVSDASFSELPSRSRSPRWALLVGLGWSAALVALALIVLDSYANVSVARSQRVVSSALLAALEPFVQVGADPLWTTVSTLEGAVASRSLQDPADFATTSRLLNPLFTAWKTSLLQVDLAFLPVVGSASIAPLRVRSPSATGSSDQCAQSNAEYGVAIFTNDSSCSTVAACLAGVSCELPGVVLDAGVAWFAAARTLFNARPALPLNWTANRQWWGPELFASGLAASPVQVAFSLIFAMPFGPGAGYSLLGRVAMNIEHLSAALTALMRGARLPPSATLYVLTPTGDVIGSTDSNNVYGPQSAASASTALIQMANIRTSGAPWAPLVPINFPTGSTISTATDPSTGWRVDVRQLNNGGVWGLAVSNKSDFQISSDILMLWIILGLGCVPAVIVLLLFIRDRFIAARQRRQIHEFATRPDS